MSYIERKVYHFMDMMSSGRIEDKITVVNLQFMVSYPTFLHTKGLNLKHRHWIQCWANWRRAVIPSVPELIIQSLIQSLKHLVRMHSFRSQFEKYCSQTLILTIKWRKFRYTFRVCLRSEYLSHNYCPQISHYFLIIPNKSLKSSPVIRLVSTAEFLNGTTNR